MSTKKISRHTIEVPSPHELPPFAALPEMNTAWPEAQGPKGPRAQGPKGQGPRPLAMTAGTEHCRSRGGMTQQPWETRTTAKHKW
jgi:hypothetical protein